MRCAVYTFTYICTFSRAYTEDSLVENTRVMHHLYNLNLLHKKNYFTNTINEFYLFEGIPNLISTQKAAGNDRYTYSLQKKGRLGRQIISMLARFVKPEKKHINTALNLESGIAQLFLCIYAGGYNIGVQSHFNQES